MGTINNGSLWFFTRRTYGSWLPGEAGFVGYYHTPENPRAIDNVLGGPTTSAIPALERFAREAMQGEPVLFTVRQGDTDKEYVVQTSTKIIERCPLMTTDPGDLVLDPTCGSGTTAYVAEQLGRRWITLDTSRVALALARTRSMAAKFPYGRIAEEPSLTIRAGETAQRDIRCGFEYKQVPHVKLKSIATNPNIKEGMTREQIDAAIRKNTDSETLYDRPNEDKNVVRVTGPFTVERLSPHRMLPSGGASAP